MQRTYTDTREDQYQIYPTYKVLHRSKSMENRLSSGYSSNLYRSVLCGQIIKSFP